MITAIKIADTTAAMIINTSGQRSLGAEGYVIVPMR
jgi:hypothetical protein